MLTPGSLHAFSISVTFLFVAVSAHAQEPRYQDTTFFNAARDGDDRALRGLLDGGANPNADNGNGWTALMLAAMNGNAGAVKVLLDHGADPNFGECEQGPPLAVAAMSPFAALDEISIIRTMIDHGAEIDIPNGSGMTPLMYATREGNLVRAAYLLERGADANHRDTRGWTPLRFAASARSTPMVQLLVAHGATPNVLDEAFRTPLHYAVTEHSPEIATILLDARADANGISVTGGYPTPIALATSKNDTAMILLLLGRGAVPNYSDMASNDDGIARTPLDWARVHRNRVAERALVTAGALSNADLVNAQRSMIKAARKGDEKSFVRFLKKGIDPRVAVADGADEVYMLDEAAAAGRLKIVRAMLASIFTSDASRMLAAYRRATSGGHADIAAIILAHAPAPLAMLAIADDDGELFEKAFAIAPDLVRYRDGEGRTPLHVAAASGNATVVSHLLARGADVSARELWTETPLFDAARSGSAEVVQLLIDAGAAAAARNLRGLTPLHAAARTGHSAVVERLAAAGADVDASDARGWRPLHHAAWIGSEASVRALVAAGATIDARDKHHQMAIDVARDMKRDDTLKQLLQ